jgi:paraquat-inducible protein B
MSKKANPTVIGIFVVGAIAIIAAGVIVLGGGSFMKERVTFVMYFDGSIKGLNVGAPVVFRGVEVGAVEDIRLEFDPRTLMVHIPVFVEFHPERVTRLHGESNPRQNIEDLIERGLRAQLEMQSLVTGMLMIAVDFFPDTPARRLGRDADVPEVPTVPTTFQALSRTIEGLELEQLVEKIANAVDSFTELVNSPDLAASLKSLDATLADVRRLVTSVDGQVEPLVASINEASEATSVVMEQATKTLSEVDGVLAEDGAPRYELINVLQELTAAARSIRVVAEYLERHPEATIHGKPGSKGKIK